MKIFLSWSGQRSQVIASCLKQWLPDVFQGLEVWMSAHDIDAGQKWGLELGEALRECKLSIICLTAENRESNWLMFEAGALSAAIDGARVIPYRFQLSKADIGPPLSQFQDVAVDEEGTFKLIESINHASSKPLLGDEQLKRAFAHWWPDLKKQLDKVEQTDLGVVRTDREVLEEVLELVRQSGVRDLNSVLNRLLSSKNVRRVEVAPKQIAGRMTNQLAFRIVVEKKLPLAELTDEDVIPPAIFGLPTDVVSMSG